MAPFACCPPWPRVFCSARERPATQTEPLGGKPIPKPRQSGALAPLRWAVAASLLTSAPLVAQGHAIDVGGHIGLFDALGAMVKTGDPSVPLSFREIRLVTAVTLGADVVYWAKPQLGVAVTAGWAPSGVAVSDSFGTHDYSGSVWHANVRGVYASAPTQMQIGGPSAGGKTTPWVLYGALGAGVVHRRGAIWANTYQSGFTSPALVLGFGTQTSLGAKLLLRIDLTDYMSFAQFDKGLPTETESRFHNDLLITAAFSARVGGHKPPANTTKGRHLRAYWNGE